MTEPTVLIIEDDPALLRGLCDNFRTRGYRVLSTQDGRQGLELALAESVDLILLDLMLPRMNGYEICQEVRRRGGQCPIIMLTAKGQEEDIIRGLELGADDYVTKPFSIRELLARAGAFLRRRKESLDETLQFGDFQLNTVARTLTRLGAEIELTVKEYRLLEYFLRHRGRALTRNSILDAVWGRDIIVTGRSVDRCVTTLRAKIESEPARPAWIQTIRDFGYRFSDSEEGTGDRD